MLSIIFISTYSAVFGIDLGDDSIKISTATSKHGMTFAMNLLSKRFNPNVISLWNVKRPKEATKYDRKEFWDYDWEIGDHAKIKCTRAPDTCLYGNTIEKPDSFASGASDNFLALKLRSMYDSVKKMEGLDYESAISIAIPPSFSASNRLEIARACSVADLNLVKIVRQSDAIAVIYGLERTSKFLNNSQNVAFIDIGARGARIYIYKFTNKEASIDIKELYSSSDESFGGEDIDKALAETLTKNHSLKFDSTARFNTFLQDVRKAKEQLTVNEKVQIKIDDTKSIEINREDLKSVCKEFFERFQAMCHEAAASVGSVDAVEAVGGSTRIIFLNDIIIKAFGVQKFGHSINADSSASIGAGYEAALQSSFFKIKKYNLTKLPSERYTLKAGNQIVELNSGDITEANAIIPRDGIVDVISNDRKLYSIIFDGKLYSNVDIRITFVEHNIGVYVPYEAIDSYGEKVQFQIEGLSDVDGSIYDELMHIKERRIKHSELLNEIEATILRITRSIEGDSELKELDTTEVVQYLNTSKSILEKGDGTTIAELEDTLNNLKDIEKVLQGVKKKTK